MTEDITKAPSGGGPDGAGKCQSRAAIDGRENKLNGRDPQGDSAPAPGALTHKRIVILDADGVEIPPGSAYVFAARTLGMSLLRNGTFRVVATYHHPNPPPPEKRRCKTINGKLAAKRAPLPDDDQAAGIDAANSARIEPGLDPPAFDREAIWNHVQTMFHLAHGLQGKFVVLALTGNKADAPYWIGHFKADGGEAEANRMGASIFAFDPSRGVHPDGRRGITQPLNMYVSWALFHPAIPRYGKGSGGPERSVIWSLAAVADVDNDKRAEAPLPFLSSCRLETSPGNFQDFFVFPRPQTFAAAKPVLRALNRLMGGDAAEQDTSHIWRIAGTLNWPTEAKIARGRPPLPFLVRWDRFPGECVDPATILAAAPAEPPRVPRVVKAVTYSDFESRKLQSALAALDPDVLPTVAKPGSLYDYWLYAGMAIHALGWGDKGLAIFDAWSQRSKHYDGEEVEAKFDSFDADRAGDRKITVASIFHWAKGEGVLLLKRRKPRHFFKKKGVRRHAR